MRGEFCQWRAVPDPTTFGRWLRGAGTALLPLLDDLLWYLSARATSTRQHRHRPPQRAPCFTQAEDQTRRQGVSDSRRQNA